VLSLGVGVNRLAGFELNKERLFAAGLLSLCFQLLDSSCTDDEILVATQTFWILSFNSAVRAEVCASHLYMQGKHAAAPAYYCAAVLLIGSSVGLSIHLSVRIGSCSKSNQKGTEKPKLV